MERVLHARCLGGARGARRAQVTKADHNQRGNNGQRYRQDNPKSDGHGFRISLTPGD